MRNWVYQVWSEGSVLMVPARRSARLRPGGAGRSGIHYVPFSGTYRTSLPGHPEWSSNPYGTDRSHEEIPWAGQSPLREFGKAHWHDPHGQWNLLWTYSSWKHQRFHLIGTIQGFLQSIHAKESCASVAFFSLAISCGSASSF